MASKKKPVKRATAKLEQETQNNPPPAGPATARFTYHLKPALADKLRDIAFWERETVNHLVQTALEKYVLELETRRGEVYPKRSGVLRRGRPLA